MNYGTPGVIRTPVMLAAAGPEMDAFSYHYYGAGIATLRRHRHPPDRPRGRAL
jgi:hypothetical protein